MSRRDDDVTAIADAAGVLRGPRPEPRPSRRERFMAWLVIDEPDYAPASILDILDRPRSRAGGAR